MNNLPVISYKKRLDKLKRFIRVINKITDQRDYYKSQCLDLLGKVKTN